MTINSEMCLKFHNGFEPLWSCQYIKRKISWNKQTTQKEKGVVSPSVSYLYDTYYAKKPKEIRRFSKTKKVNTSLNFKNFIKVRLT